MTATATKERPILFSGEMVRAILDGRKTQTRRAIKPQPPSSESVANHAGIGYHWMNCGDQGAADEWRPVGPVWAVMKELGDGKPRLKCTYGQPGDRLWVRETWGAGWHDGHGGYSALRPTGPQHEKPDKVFYKADFPADDEKNGKRCWRPSIHMPRWASRLTLEIVSVRVERLQDISEADCIAEGCPGSYTPAYVSFGEICGPDGTEPRDDYRDLWNTINGPGAWEANPWVWVIEFKKMEAQ